MILRGVSLELSAGELVVIIGPNGAGKSTLIKSIFGLLRTTSGSVTLDGEDITRLKPHSIVGRGVGYVPQVANVFPSLTVEENLDMGA
ncbi:MAG: ATP-binding cassette domain-containing protein, partial [Acidimicrobiia bacterium]|nr:ATP-binding cassette domain-containing protein [Acidimicrobiia bacterium]